MQNAKRARCVVVTGASRGIGAAIAHALALAGHTVGCLSRSGDAPNMDNVSEEIRSRWITVACDVTQANAVAHAIEAVASAANGPVSGWVNNAGMHLSGASKSFSLQDYESVMSANATSVFLSSQCAYPHLARAGGGLIVNIGSFYDKLGVKQNLAYCASKAAVAAMTRCLAVEWAGAGIRVVNVAPGYVLTDLNRVAMGEEKLQAYLKKRIPTGGPCQAEDVGRFVAQLFTVPHPFLTGSTIYLDGGQGVAL